MLWNMTRVSNGCVGYKHKAFRTWKLCTVRCWFVGNRFLSPPRIWKATFLHGGFNKKMHIIYEYENIYIYTQTCIYPALPKHCNKCKSAYWRFIRFPSPKMHRFFNHSSRVLATLNVYLHIPWKSKTIKPIIPWKLWLQIPTKTFFFSKNNCLFHGLWTPRVYVYIHSYTSWCFPRFQPNWDIWDIGSSPEVGVRIMFETTS